MLDLQKEICRYDTKIDKILNGSPLVARSSGFSDKINKFNELFNKEDSYAVFMTVVFKLMTNIMNANRLMGCVIERIDNHELRVKILELAQDYLGEVQDQANSGRT